MKTVTLLRHTGLFLLPLCAGAVITGCSTQSELPLPPGAYVEPKTMNSLPPENSSASTLPASIEDLASSEMEPEDTTENFNFESYDAKEVKPADKAPAAGKTVSAAKDDQIYKIRKNDTLGGIANRYGMKAQTLADYNGITTKTPIYAGKTLRIPAGFTLKTIPATSSKTAAVKASAAVASAAAAGSTIYVVKQNDTLGGIAQKNSVRLADLVEVNHLDSKKMIYPGQKLVIPEKKITAAKKNKKKAAPVAKAPSAPVRAPASIPAAAPAAASAEAPAAAPVADVDSMISNIQTDAAPAVEPAAPAEAPAAPAAPAAATPAAVPAAVPEASAPVDMDNAISVNIDREMTLEEAARAYDRPYNTVKRLNPGISTDARMKAGTSILIPIFLN